MFGSIAWIAVGRFAGARGDGDVRGRDSSGLNMVGVAVRDLLDPRLRGGSGRLGAYGAQAVRRATLPARPARK